MILAGSGSSDSSGVYRIQEFSTGQVRLSSLDPSTRLQGAESEAVYTNNTFCGHLALEESLFNQSSSLPLLQQGPLGCRKLERAQQ